MNPVLILLLFLCHWLGDFSPLQTAWMLRAKADGKLLLPILAHAGVHALLMGICLLFFSSGYTLLYMALLQWGSHFFIDTLKAKMNVWFPQLHSPSSRSHWLVFGADQMLHHAIMVLMAWYVYLHP